ncbi:DUF4282 domain-containing protein [Caulobacter sp. 17J65-9]|uniref:DUF4282 domain-containing protein n=1 Tax=Caulobacter sp. 17J65-9 TaxID=2709382 RepID=UPI0013C59253|nr:DUF4282 domain-containing protein [Caulobacter sp. 17J65-9]NEX94972.1 DUF4282 domain-containing protein [Caulobacter sp. 17J65-9]
MKGFQKTSPGELFWDLITFDKLMTGPVVHIIYWAGLCLILLAGFSVVGGAFGMALREGGIMGWMLAIPVVVMGMLALAAGALLWRAFCEFYVAIFRISDDLRAIRNATDRGGPTVSPLTSPLPKEEKVSQG